MNQKQSLKNQIHLNFLYRYHQILMVKMVWDFSYKLHNRIKILLQLHEVEMHKIQLSGKEIKFFIQKFFLRKLYLPFGMSFFVQHDVQNDHPNQHVPQKLYQKNIQQLPLCGMVEFPTPKNKKKENS